MLWGWAIDGTAPNCFDVIGGAIAMVGVVLFGRQVFVRRWSGEVLSAPGWESRTAHPHGETLSRTAEEEP